MSELKPFDEFMDALVHCDTVKVILTGCGESTFETKPIYEGICALANRRVQPANEPLKLEQLLEMEQHGEGIYVTHADGSPIFRGKQYTAAVLDRIAAFVAMGYHLQAIYGRGLTLAEDDCGKTWLAYRRPPEGSENDG